MLCALHASHPLHTDVPAITDDQMIYHLDPQQIAAFDQHLGRFEIFGTRRWVAARMIMHEKNGCRTFFDGLMEYFSGVYKGRRQLTDRNGLVLNDFSFRI